MAEQTEQGNRESQEQKEARKAETEASEIALLVRKITDTNRKIDEAYEEKLRRLEAKKKMLPEESSEEQKQARISLLKEKLAELRTRIGEARRNGKDSFMAELMLKNINAKIKMAEVTNEQKDFATVETILNNAGLELNEALREKEVNVKKELEKRLREDIARETGRVMED